MPLKDVIKGNIHCSSDEDDICLKNDMFFKKKKRLVNSDSESENNEENKSESINETISNSDIEEKECFDKNSESPIGSVKHENDDSIIDRCSDSNVESGEENRVISTTLKRRLAKGAAKNSKPISRSNRNRTSKQLAEIKLKSETQRLIRESAVSIPRYKPPSSNLQSFLENSKRKRSKSLFNKDVKLSINKNNQQVSNIDENISAKQYINIDIEEKKQNDDSGDELPDIHKLISPCLSSEIKERPVTPKFNLSNNILHTKLTPKLGDLDLSLTPLLSVEQQFINLDNSDDNDEANGINSLINRATKHVHSSSLKNNQGKASAEKVEKFHNSTISKLEIDDNDTSTSPHAKYEKLKEKLKQEMKRKREILREQRNQLFNLDNEDIDSNKLDEEEAEFTDDEDCGDNDSISSLESITDDNDMEIKIDKNEFIDDEADIDDEDDNLMLVETDDDDEYQDTKRKTLPPQYDAISDDARSTPSDINSDEVVTKISSRPFSQLSSMESDLDNSFDLTLLPAAQAPRLLDHSTPKLTNRSQSRCNIFSDSQDTFSLPIAIQSQPRGRLDDSKSEHSFLLDEDGLLKEKNSRKSTMEILKLRTDKSDENIEDELLDLCSGNFSSQKNDSFIGETEFRIGSFALHTQKLINEYNQDDKASICEDDDESDIEQVHTTKQRKNIFLSERDDEIENLKPKILSDDDDDDDFQIENNNTVELSVENEEISGDEQDLVDEYFDVIEKANKKVSAKDFFENEAELSGSDVGSDEDDDLNEEDDILQEEEGDKDLKDMDEELLRDQVGRVHLKNMLDEDDRNIKLYQELLLPDGDLHSDLKRKRRFKWKGLQEWDGRNDMSLNGEGEVENDVEKRAGDLKILKDRIEREELVEKLSESQDDNKNDSQIIQLGMKVVKAEKEIKVVNKVVKSGSFLVRDINHLKKINESFKPQITNGARSSSNKFVFSTTSPPTKRTNIANNVKQKPSKKAKTEIVKITKQITRQTSVFDHL